MSKALPSDWSYATLTDVADIDSESLKNSTEPDFRFRYIDIASVSTGKIEKPMEYIRYSVAPSRARRVLRTGDILMSTVRPNLKAFAYFNFEENDFVASTGFAILRPKSANDGRFIFNSILSDHVSRQIEALVVGSNYPAINSSDVKNLEILQPPLPEQQKIAAILTSVDEVIESTQAQINKLKDLKTGMMQELLTKGIGRDGLPHTEFKDSPVGRIPKEWEVTKVGDVLDTIESGWSPLCETFPAMTGEWGVLKTTAVTWNGFNFKENKKLPASLEPRINIQVETGDVLVTRAGPLERVGVVAHVDYVPTKIMLSDKIIRLKTNNRCISKYLSYWLSTNYVQGQFSLQVSGLAQSQTNISQEILKSPSIAIPSLEEQILICKAMTALEHRINAVAEKLEQTVNIKKALMQDLLTGKVRVKVN